MGPSTGHGNGEETLSVVYWGFPRLGLARIPGRKDSHSLQHRPGRVRSDGEETKQMNKPVTNTVFMGQV